MKKLFVLLFVGLTSALYANEQIVRQKGCMACHDMKVKKVGPSFKEIAEKYKTKENAVGYLVDRIKKGGVGVWGNVPMPPQNVSEAEAKQIAEWIISLKEVSP